VVKGREPIRVYSAGENTSGGEELTVSSEEVDSGRKDGGEPISWYKMGKETRLYQE